MDLLEYFKENPDIDRAPFGIHAICHDTEPGVLFVLKNLGAELQKIDRNVRQILKHLDADPLYAADAEDIRKSLKECWLMVRQLYQEVLRYMK